MQSIELVLDFSLYVVWYGFFTLFIFDFLLGLFVLMKQALEAPSVQVISSVNQHNQHNPQSTPLQPTEKIEYENEQLPEASIVPASKADEATIQYLEMTGCDINDFNSIQEARKFLDEFAPWTIEEMPAQGVKQPQSIQLQSQSIAIIPDPWIEPFGELPPIPKELKLQLTAPISKAVKKNRNKRKQSKEVKLSFNQVCVEFAEIGLALERFRTGHYCYRVVFGCDSHCRFKTLQEALDWLAVKKQSMQDAQTKSNPVDDELQTTRLTFKQVCLEFEKRGYKFERCRAGKFRYKFWLANGGFSYKFKTLQDAADWLVLSQQPKRIITIKA